MKIPIKKTPQTRILFFLAADIILITLAVVLAFLLRFDGQIPQLYFDQGILYGMIVLGLVFCLPIFYFMGLYSFSWVFVSANEAVALIKAVSLSFVFITASIFILRTFQGFPRSTLIISYFLILVFCGAIRFAKRAYLEMFRKSETNKRKSLIVGAGEAGEQILRGMLISKESQYSPIGFVDDSPFKQGVAIHGIKVLGRFEDIPRIVKKYEIEELIIALPSLGSDATKRAVELGREAGLRRIKVVPSMGEIIGGKISIRDLREIQVEDLLGREPVVLDIEPIEAFIKNKTILITGAAGSIGSELVRQAAKFGPSLLLLLDQDETGIFNISKEIKRKFPEIKFKSLVVDVRDKEKIKQVFNQFKPNIVFHAAAYKHVPLMEEQPEEAVKNNIFGTKTVADAALAVGTDKFVFISTDKAVNPSSIMGATKRAGEMVCQALNQKNHTKFISVRFGNVLGSRGSVIPVFKEQIRKGGPVEVTHPEMKRYFMMIPEAVLLVMQAGEMGQGGEVFVLDMGKPVKIIDLAREIIRLSGFEPDKDIPIVFTQPRPGEKLFEEILTAEEGTIATKNQKIFIAKLTMADENKVINSLNKLEKEVQNSEKEILVDTLKELIPKHELDKSN